MYSHSLLQEWLIAFVIFIPLSFLVLWKMQGRIRSIVIAIFFLFTVSPSYYLLCLCPEWTGIWPSFIYTKGVLTGQIEYLYGFLGSFPMSPVLFAFGIFVICEKIRTIKYNRTQDTTFPPIF